MQILRLKCKSVKKWIPQVCYQPKNAIIKHDRRGVAQSRPICSWPNRLVSICNTTKSLHDFTVHELSKIGM